MSFTRSLFITQLDFGTRIGYVEKQLKFQCLAATADQTDVLLIPMLLTSALPAMPSQLTRDKLMLLHVLQHIPSGFL